MAKTVYRLSEAARVLNCSVDSLKRYEQRGLIAYRRLLGQRVLTADDIATLRTHRATFRRHNRATVTGDTYPTPAD